MSRPSRQAVDKELEDLALRLNDLKHKEMDFQILLNKLNEMKREVTTERREVEKRQEELESQKQPINWLPTELMTLIFRISVRLCGEESGYLSPVVISHVSSKWRAIALSTPDLWSRLILNGWNSGITDNFLSRSREARLSISYQSQPHSKPSEECRQVTDLLAMTSQHFGRCEELTFRVNLSLPIVYLLPFLDNFSNTFQRLQHLALAVAHTHPNFIESRSLIQREKTIMQRQASVPINSESSSLLHLSLERVPLFNFPHAFIANLRRLELSYSARTRNTSRFQYFLKLTTLCHFLALTPNLEELVLKGTVPYFDAVPSSYGEISHNVDLPPNVTQMHPVNLRRFKSLEWTYPYSADIPRFLCMLDLPHLERIDIWVESTPYSRPTEVMTSRGYNPSASAYQYIHATPSFPSLRDISLQCTRDEATICFLRKFSFIKIEELAFTNTDVLLCESGDDPALPTFPRLESVFRDPRLPHLTHLTLSHFEISMEPGRSESFLGYMPALRSLSFDSCTGVISILEGLGGTLSIFDPLLDETYHQGQVKLCPKLEALSLWRCHDVEFTHLKAVVISRNPSVVGNMTQKATIPSMAKGQKVEKDEAGHRRSDTPHCKGPIPSARRIKPLRKQKGQVIGKLSATTVAHQVTKPMNIRYVRVAECRLVDGHALSSLQDFGVVDIIWVEKRQE